MTRQMVDSTTGASTTAFTYDDWGRMVAAFTDAAPKTRTTDSRQATQKYRWDVGYHRLAKYTDSDTDWDIENLTETYVPDPSSPIGVLADVSTAGTYGYYHGDHLGSVRQIRNQSKVSVAKYEFDPYGGAYDVSGLPLDYGYTSHTWDADAGE